MEIKAPDPEQFKDKTFAKDIGEFKFVVPNIYEVKEMIVEADDNVWEPGFYHLDETWDFHGPFKTHKEAHAALTLYISML